MRRLAYAAHVDAGDGPAAAMAAWHLYHDHALVGEAAAANGWVRRARQHAGPPSGSIVDGFVAVAEADHAQGRGAMPEALASADRAVAIGRATGDRDLLAMGLQTHGRLLVAVGQVPDGVALLDDAMLCAVAGELRPLFTGWVYCSVLGVCHDIADLGRAAEWTDAALRWCDDAGDGLLYPGLCRIHRVELACLHGAWSDAEEEAARACDELLAHDPRYAGEAVYLAADLHRLRGDFTAAEAGYQHAHTLGREPQPGLALVWLAQGRPAAAAAALRLALEPGPSAPLPRAGLLAALVDAELALGETGRAAAAADELADLAGAGPSRYLEALAAARDGAVRVATDDAPAGLAQLRRAKSLLQELSMPYETARVQVGIADASRRAGDHDTAELELRAARSTFTRLGAEHDLHATEAMPDVGPTSASPLTAREVEVLRLVADGRTNRQIADALVISEHTVARHLSNIFTKLGVHTRSAATAYAYEHHLVS